jgi:hypothetical protein
MECYFDVADKTTGAELRWFFFWVRMVATAKYASHRGALLMAITPALASAIDLRRHWRVR